MTRRRAILLALACLCLFAIPSVRDRTFELVKAEQAFALPYYERSRPDIVALLEYAREPGDTVRLMVNGKPVNVAKSAPLASVPAEDDLGLNTGPSMDAGEVEAVLAEYNSPAAGKGLGEWSVEESRRTGVDNAYWLAMFIHESSAGSNQGWAGIKPGGHTTANTGNLIAAPGYGNYGRFADFQDDWKAGTTAHFNLIVDYRDTEQYGHKHKDIKDVINTWAPSNDGNDPNSYGNVVANFAREARQVKKNVTVEAPAAPAFTGKKHPVTDDYQINPNARFNTVGPSWSFQANSQHWGTDVLGVDGQAVYAPYDGSYIMTGSYPEGGATAGQYVMMYDERGAEIYLGHLKNAIQMEAGQPIKAGTKVGEIRGDLAHTHVQLRLNGQLADWEPYYESH